MGSDSDRSDLDRSRRLTVPGMVSRSARRDPAAPALAFEGERRSFGGLEERSDRLAAALIARGVGPDDKVAMLQYNGIEFVEAFLGIQKVGACAVPVNFRLSREEVDYVLSDSGSVLVLADPELALAEQTILVTGSTDGHGRRPRRATPSGSWTWSSAERHPPKPSSRC